MLSDFTPSPALLLFPRLGTAAGLRSIEFGSEFLDQFEADSGLLLSHQPMATPAQARPATITAMPEFSDLSAFVIEDAVASAWPSDPPDQVEGIVEITDVEHEAARVQPASFKAGSAVEDLIISVTEGTAPAHLASSSPAQSNNVILGAQADNAPQMRPSAGLSTPIAPPNTLPDAAKQAGPLPRTAVTALADSAGPKPESALPAIASPKVRPENGQQPVTNAPSPSTPPGTTSGSPTIAVSGPNDAAAQPLIKRTSSPIAPHVSPSLLVPVVASVADIHPIAAANSPPGHSPVPSRAPQDTTQVSARLDPTVSTTPTAPTPMVPLQASSAEYRVINESERLPVAVPAVVPDLPNRPSAQQISPAVPSPSAQVPAPPHLLEEVAPTVQSPSPDLGSIETPIGIADLHQDTALAPPLTRDTGPSDLPQIRANRISTQIVARVITAAGVTDANAPLELTLDPPELGNLRITISRTDDQIMMNVTIDRPETLELMRRHQILLTQELQRHGLDSSGFTFSGRGDNPQDQQQINGSHPDQPQSEVPPAPETIHNLRLTGGLDIRI